MGEGNEPLSEKYRMTAESWVDAEAAANLLEETKSAFLAESMSRLGDMPVSRAEMLVKGSTYWRLRLEDMVEARKKATLLKVQLEFIRMKHAEQQSAEASRRAEMRL